MQANALRRRGWSISAIARHLGRDPKTIRKYLNGDAVVGERKRSAPDVFAKFVPYLKARFAEDPHVWATALFDELVPLGFDHSYQTLTRELRVRKLRPHCEACAGVKGRATIEIDHPPGEEIQWDWLELPDAPWGDDGHLLVGSLPCSAKFRGVFCDAEDQPHLIEGIDGVLRRFGGTARRWRVDRMATVIVPNSDRVQRSFLPVAKHYGVIVDPCPPRRGNRKGSVEKSIHYLTQRWWRTARVNTMEEAQRSFDRFCATVADLRFRPAAQYAEMLGLSMAPGASQTGPVDTKVRPVEQRTRVTVAELAGHEPLLALPAVGFPATVEVDRTVNDHALVAFRGNLYSTPAGLIGTAVKVRHRLTSTTLEISTVSGMIVASHHLQPAGAGVIERLAEHRHELEQLVLSSFTTARPCNRKINRPPGDEAMAEAFKLLTDTFGEVTVDLDDYERLVVRP